MKGKRDWVRSGREKRRNSRNEGLTVPKLIEEVREFGYPEDNESNIKVDKTNSKLRTIADPLPKQGRNTYQKSIPHLNPFLAIPSPCY